MKILFLNDCNGHEGSDPLATLIEFQTHSPINENLFMDSVKKLELNQLGATRMEGRLDELLEDIRKLGIGYKQISTGKDSGYYKDLPRYRMISGNY